VEILIISNPETSKLKQLGVHNWPIWEKEKSTFPWHYNETEVCYILEGEVTVKPKDGTTVTLGKGDLVTFPKGLDCSWEITQDLRKHYSFTG